jgi:hypothetical protein
MMDPPSSTDPDGDGVYVAYVKNPVDNYVSGITGGLDQGEADDFDNIQYTGGTQEVDGAFFSVVQVQGNPKVATARITAFDTPNDTPATALQGVNLVTHNFAADPKATIDGVTITRGADGSTVTATGGVDFDGIDFQADGSVLVSGTKAGDKIAFKTVGDHDVALIQSVSGKFDIGDYGIDLFNPTPDQQLEFESTITDGDNDTDADIHLIGIDGTGLFKDGVIVV